MWSLIGEARARFNKTLESLPQGWIRMKIKFWRIYPTDLPSSGTYAPPASLMRHTRCPRPGDCLLAASFDAEARTGVVSRLGVIDAQNGDGFSVEWQECHAEIWVDSSIGSRFWTQPDGFAFADKKIGDYGLAELFAQAFPDTDISAPEPSHAATTSKKPRVKGAIASERLTPIEVIGEPTNSPRAGVVYVLKSAYGYKVGRTRNVPARMRAFGVHLPFFYTIPLCAWFDDCVLAEGRYHDVFRSQRINGEWFDLSEDDIELIRSRQFVAPSLQASSRH